MFIAVPERKALVEEEITRDVVRKEVGKFVHILKKLRHEKNLRNCLLANFLAVDATNTAILFFTTFLMNAIFHDLAHEEMVAKTTNQMTALTISAIVMSFLIGWLTDRIGSKPSFLVAALSMAAACLCGCFLPRGWVFYVTVTVFGGAGLAGAWTAGRKLLADITPPGKEGEYFGLYGLTNKSSAFGTIVFAVLTYVLPKFGLSEPAAYRVGFLFPLLTLAGSLFFLRKVRTGVGPPSAAADQDDS
jgi:UMF1 family MFS transporter